MSVVFVVIPVVAGAWPVVSAAILAASAAMGYRALQNAEERLARVSCDLPERAMGVDLVMENSQVVAESLARGDSFRIQRGDVTATFRRDARGRCTVHLEGAGRSELELQAAGEELMDRVRQQFAYAKVMSELETRGFNVVHEEVEADRSIRIRVQRAH